MKRVMLPVWIALVSLPAFAQSLELIGRFAYVKTDTDQQIEDRTDPGDTRLEIDSETGWGGAINVYWTRRISTEIGASLVEPGAIITVSGDTSAALLNPSLTLIPITAILQYHFSSDGPWDLYIGAGGAWTLIDDIEGDLSELEPDDIERIEFDDDAGFAVNLGINIKLTDNISVNIDSKYVPLKAPATVVFASGDTATEREVEFNPLIISAGAGIRF